MENKLFKLVYDKVNSDDTCKYWDYIPDDFNYISSIFFRTENNLNISRTINRELFGIEINKICKKK